MTATDACRGWQEKERRETHDEQRSVIKNKAKEMEEVEVA